jgi:hypothetical protein
MAESTAVTRKSIVLLCVKFLVLAPVCLVVWLLLLQYYVRAVGESSSFLLKHVLKAPIVSTYAWNLADYKRSIQVPPPPPDEASAPVRFFHYVVRQTQTTLKIVVETKSTEPKETQDWNMFDVGHLMVNVAPFVALVLATAGLGLLRRMWVMVLGIGLIFASHVLTVILGFSFGRTPLPTAIGFISITLPFLLWIVLAYWSQLTSFFADEPSAPAQKK